MDINLNNPITSSNTKPKVGNTILSANQTTDFSLPQIPDAPHKSKLIWIIPLLLIVISVSVIEFTLAIRSTIAKSGKLKNKNHSSSVTSSPPLMPSGYPK